VHRPVSAVVADTCFAQLELSIVLCDLALELYDARSTAREFSWLDACLDFDLPGNVLLFFQLLDLLCLKSDLLSQLFNLSALVFLFLLD
jgi:hypothetical protein